jgi:carboxyl-terminal processing protease
MRDQRVEFAVLPRAETYGGKLAILVDELSASAAECLAGGLQDLGRGRVFGKRTAGAVLNSEIEVLPNGDALQFATADFVSPAGTRLEGRGVIPDVEVATKREDFVAGRDPVLEAALEWIREPDVSDRNGGSAPVNHREARER